MILTCSVTPAEREELAACNSPVFLAKLHDSELIEGSTVHFMIKVKGDPIPDCEL